MRVCDAYARCAHAYAHRNVISGNIVCSCAYARLKYNDYLNLLLLYLRRALYGLDYQGFAVQHKFLAHRLFRFVLLCSSLDRLTINRMTV